MKNKLLDIVKRSKPYEFYRKARLLVHLNPVWAKVWSFIKHYFGGLYDRIDRHHVFLLSGGLAFSLFTCIIPLVLIAFWILGNFLSSEEMELQIINLINTVIPYDQYAEFTKQIIFSRVYEVVEFKNAAGIIGFVGLFFAASGFFSSMRTVLNKINGQEVDVNFFLGKLRDFLIIIVAILLFFASILALPFIELLRKIANVTEYLQFFNAPVFQQLYTILISFLVILFLMYLFYRLVPTRKIRRTSALMGAIWASLLWVGAKTAFGYYISHFQTWGRIYGTYALLVVIAFWIYYTAAVFIIGAEIGKLFDERRSEGKETKLKN
ncbi:Putative membrane protein [Ignavibacterium album JCM 16511]|uniref:Putative membrane protein n=1 Tax=Ignavibacterium album (strain DSM 19864 / JCM 16511 / NBRC 101810 / Mat9-16) TaxID=945713 RepID=I0AHV0_IGNAJ|nr:YihY/virulence factor BrkB family protein [Ignavibacterium album]AFH48557.1 Putative membrane protein [Ignavibacterium album JCM 16511]